MWDQRRYKSVWGKVLEMTQQALEDCGRQRQRLEEMRFKLFLAQGSRDNGVARGEFVAFLPRAAPLVVCSLLSILTI